MKRLFFISSVLLLFQYGLTAQEYVMLAKKPAMLNKELPNVSSSKPSVFEYDIYSKPELNKDIDPQLIGSHFLGKEIARKMYLLDKTYTYEDKVAPGNPATTTSIRKPLIYNSVKKIEAYFRKSIRKRQVSEEVATEQFNKVVDVALNIFFQNTDALENQLKTTDKTSDLLELFTQRIHLNYKQ
jgi:hypothetical protein